LAVNKSTGTLNGGSSISTPSPNSPAVTTPSSVDLAVTRRTQSRYEYAINRILHGRAEIRILSSSVEKISHE
jgi:hypothetical protein